MQENSVMSQQKFISKFGIWANSLLARFEEEVRAKNKIFNLCRFSCDIQFFTRQNLFDSLAWVFISNLIHFSLAKFTDKYRNLHFFTFFKIYLYVYFLEKKIDVVSWVVWVGSKKKNNNKATCCIVYVFCAIVLVLCW